MKKVILVATLLFSGCKAADQKLKDSDVVKALEKRDGYVSISRTSTDFYWKVTISKKDVWFEGKGWTISLAYEDALKKIQEFCQ